MNEALAITVGIGIGGIITFLLVLLGRGSHDRSGLSGTTSGNGSVGGLNKEAGSNNKRLEDEERRTAELIREQESDIEQAERTNQSASDLVQKGKEILNHYNNNK